MTVTCRKCGKTYDDVYRWTYCPHNSFQMRTEVFSGGEYRGVATTLEELDRLMKK